MTLDFREHCDGIVLTINLNVYHRFKTLFLAMIVDTSLFYQKIEAKDEGSNLKNDHHTTATNVCSTVDC